MAEEKPNSASRTLVVSLGKKKRKQVRRRKKGRGKLNDRVLALVADLKEGGELSADADTVIIIIEKKKRRAWRW
jgi:hypothetical protein